MADTTPTRRRNITTASELPIDIILHHIAPRLPAKSVLRLMTVSKEFHTFLKTQKFAKMHLHHVNNDHHQNHDKLIVLSPTKSLFSVIDCEKAYDSSTLPNRPLPFIAGYHTHLEILTSFNGLVCAGIFQRQYWPTYTDLILWNPVTSDYKILSKTNYDMPSYESERFHKYGLYYSSCDDDYKLLHVTTPDTSYIYSLKSDSWRKLVGGIRAYSNRSVWFNENLYFLDVCPCYIMRFDTKTEKFTKITIPCLSEMAYLEAKIVSVIVHKDCIHLYVRYDQRSRLVVMKYEPRGMNGAEKWTKVDTCEVPMVDSSTSTWRQHWMMRLRLHWMRNGNWLMTICDRTGTRCLQKLDLEMKVNTHLGVFTDWDDIPYEGRYTETLVSPNQYMNN